jgi:hypothetical protein
MSGQYEYRLTIIEEASDGAVKLRRHIHNQQLPFVPFVGLVLMMPYGRIHMVEQVSWVVGDGVFDLSLAKEVGPLSIKEVIELADARGWTVVEEIPLTPSEEPPAKDDTRNMVRVRGRKRVN